MNGKKLYKSTTDKKLCGVCGGVAEYFGIDSTIVRLLLVLFTLIGGSGVLLYIIAALIMNDDPGVVDTEYHEAETADSENPYYKE